MFWNPDKEVLVEKINSFFFFFLRKELCKVERKEDEEKKIKTMINS